MDDLVVKFYIVVCYNVSISHFIHYHIPGTCFSVLCGVVDH